MPALRGTDIFLIIVHEHIDYGSLYAWMKEQYGSVTSAS